MNSKRSKNLFVRVSEEEKQRIESNAEMCGLTLSEYLRQRALGYMPRAVLPEAFFAFSDSLDRLCDVCSGKISAETENRILRLMDDITEKLILPAAERDRA